MLDQRVSPITDPLDIFTDIFQCIRVGRIETVIIGNSPLIRDILIFIKKQTIQFKRIDADLTEELREDGEADETTVKTLTEVFRKNLGKDKLEVKVEKLKNEGTAAMITLPEESRRMQDMMKMYNMYGMDPNMFGGQEVLVLNANHPLVRFIAENQGSEYVPVICEQLYDLAMMSHKQLSPEEMTKFVKRSNDILMVLTK